MNPAIFYVSSIVLSATGIFFLWQLGLKPLMLDDFRDGLFATRDRLYELAREGKLDCEDPAYRAVELFVNRIIRYAHRFTFLSFLMTARHLEHSDDAEAASYVTDRMLRSIDKVPDGLVRAELLAIVDDVTRALPSYIGRSSLMFIVGSLIYFALRPISSSIASQKQQAVQTFEAEAYRDSKFEGYAPA